MLKFIKKYPETLNIKHILLFFILIGILRIVNGYETFGNTADEIGHISGGLEWFQAGTNKTTENHTQLARIASAVLPYLYGTRLINPEKINCGKSFSEYYLENAKEDAFYYAPYCISKIDWGLIKRSKDENILTLARLPHLIFYILAIIYTYLLAKVFFSRKLAILSAFIVSIMPNILAYSMLVTTDLPLFALFIVVIYHFHKWVQKPDLKNTLILAFILPLYLTTKVTAFLYFGIFTLIYYVIYLSSEKFIKTNYPKILLIIVISFINIWAIYKFSLGSAQNTFPLIYQLMQNKEFLDNYPSLSHLFTLNIIPFPEFYQSILNVYAKSKVGHATYLFGVKMNNEGSPYYFSVVLLYKTSILLIIPFFIGALGLLFTYIQKRQNFFTQYKSSLMLFLSFMIVMLLILSTSNVNLGVRHILYLYLSIILIASLTIFWLFNNYKKLRPVIYSLSFIYILGSFSQHPDYLTKFSALKYLHNYDVLLASNLDWIQDNKRLTKNIGKNNIYRSSYCIWNNYFDFEKPNYLVNFNCKKEIKNGYFSVSKFMRYVVKESNLKWLNSHTPIYMIGDTIQVYYIPEEKNDL